MRNTAKSKIFQMKDTLNNVEIGNHLPVFLVPAQGNPFLSKLKLKATVSQVSAS